MLQQMSEATLTLLLTMLAVGAVICFMPATGRGRRGKKARSRAVWFGIALGLVSSLALTAVNVEAPKLINRQTVGLITLPIAIEFPPIEVVPPISQGYMVIEAQ